MEYSRIETLRKQNKVSKKEIAKHLNMTAMGYSKMIENKTCTVSTIELIAKFYNVPVGYFFTDDNNILYEPNVEYNRRCNGCEQKDELIKQLKQHLSDLREMYGLAKKENPNGIDTQGGHFTKKAN